MGADANVGANFISRTGARCLAGTPSAVPSPFHTLLDATLRHLSDLEQEGVRYVSVSTDALNALTRRDTAPAAPRSTRPARGGPELPNRPAASTAPALRPPGWARNELPARTAPVPRPPPAGETPKPGFVPSPERPREAEEAMAELRAQAMACERCPHLVASRTQVVFGVGTVSAELLFVGEAPGADEDRHGEPFVGKAGQLLTRIITAMGRSRESVYIANILKCRPDMPPGQWGNRAPRPEEMQTCLPFLVRQIEIIRPKVIVALGGTAVKGLLGDTLSIGSARGRWHDFRGTPVMPTFHPAYLLRAEEGPDKGIGEKRKTWEDMLQVLDRLGWPVTGKMRGYFARGAG
jgi:uracil-DNA glycosylase family 4